MVISNQLHIRSPSIPIGGECLLGEANLERLGDEWARALVRLGRAPDTVKSYGWALADFRRYCAGLGVIDCHELRRQHVQGWQDAIAERRVAPSSRSLAATALRRFLQWLAVNDHPVDPNLWLAVERVRVRKGRPRPLSEQDFRRLISYLLPRWPHTSMVALRNRALILFLIATGARLSEALQVRRDDFASAVVRRKGGQLGELEPSALALAAVEDYLERREDQSPWLWVHHDPRRSAGRLSAEGVRHICREVARRASIPPFQPHRLRHTSASMLYDELGDPLAAARHLGHADLATIQTYAEVSPKRRRAVSEAIDKVFLEQMEAEIRRLRRLTDDGLESG